MRRALIAIAGALILGAVPVAGQGAGSAASVVLRLTPSPRGVALGGAMAAVGDAFAVEFNPAVTGLAAARAAAAYQMLPVDVVAGAAAFGFDAPGGAAAVSLRFVDYGEVDVLEEDGGSNVGVPTGETATGGEVTALAGYALVIGPLRIGVAGRWLRVDVAGLTDDAFAADVGALLTAVDWLAVGLAVQNVGPEVEAGRAAPLPAALRVGARLSRAVGPLQAMMAVEGRRREERNGLGVGLEVGAGSPSLRADARVGYETRGAAGDAYSRLVFGGGVRVDRVGVDFAYRALGPLGATKQFGLSLLF